MTLEHSSAPAGPETGRYAGSANPAAFGARCRLRLFLRIAALILAISWLEPVLGHGLGVVIGLGLFFAMAPCKPSQGRAER